MVLFDEENGHIIHYGVKRRSGRYPWGSGGPDLGSSSKGFGSELAAANGFDQALQVLRKQSGMSDTQIAKAFGLTTPELRANISISDAIRKEDRRQRIETLRVAGENSPTAISRKTGIPEGTVRSVIKNGSEKTKSDQLRDAADSLKKRVEESQGFIDVGKGTQHYLNISKTRLDTVLAMLQTEGHAVESVRMPQVGRNDNQTQVRVLAKRTWKDPADDWKQIKANMDKVEPVSLFGQDGKFKLVNEPVAVNPNRVQVKWGSEGGKDADGVIFVRPGVPDLYMGNSKYAQVRIQVGPNHYLKGMAIKKSGLPDGVDLQFNTNKSRKENKMDAMKELVKTGQPIERFGAIFRQVFDPKTGKQSAINMVNEDEDWDKWSKNLASQMLSKQKPELVQRQLNVSLANKRAQLDEILSLTHPVVKKKLLDEYAETMDAASVRLQAAALPRQRTHVLIPIKTLKDTEVYAPGYKNGESLALVRFPHGGKFEIPILNVNNGNSLAQRLIGNDSRNAIGINAEVAKRLSGADFDGDTVVVIPNSKGRIKNEPAYDRLRNFDPQVEYKGSNDGKTMLPGVKPMRTTQTSMGMISNLITDMHIIGAPPKDIVNAVRHSMVVIDAEKHKLNYQKSYRDHGIQALQAKYQGKASGGAVTIISRTGGKVRREHMIPRPHADGGPIDKNTGEKIMVPSGKMRPKPVKDAETGEITWTKVPQMEKVKRGATVKDAFELVNGGRKGGNAVERHYAEYSNSVKALANEARKVSVNTPDPKISKSAQRIYKNEYESLKAKLVEAQKNSPRERQAHMVAQTILKVRKAENPNMTDEEISRAETNSLKYARGVVGSKPYRIDFTDREWRAVQEGAIGSTALREILTKADMTAVKERATPKRKLLMQPHNEVRARRLLDNGYTLDEVADELGVSVSTLNRSLSGS